MNRVLLNWTELNMFLIQWWHHFFLSLLFVERCDTEKNILVLFQHFGDCFKTTTIFPYLHHLETHRIPKTCKFCSGTGWLVKKKTTTTKPTLKNLKHKKPSPCRTGIPEHDPMLKSCNVRLPFWFKTCNGWDVVVCKQFTVYGLTSECSARRSRRAMKSTVLSMIPEMKKTWLLWWLLSTQS